MFIREMIEHLATTQVKHESYRKFRASMVYPQIKELSKTIEVIFEAYCFGFREVSYDDKPYRLDEYVLPIFLGNQLKYSSIYMTAEGLFERNIKPLLKLSCSSEKFENVVSLHPTQFHNLFEELVLYVDVLKAGSPISIYDSHVSNVTEVGRICLDSGDYKVSESTNVVWISRFENFKVESNCTEFCVKMPSLFEVGGGMNGFINIIS